MHLTWTAGCVVADWDEAEHVWVLSRLLLYRRGLTMISGSFESVCESLNFFSHLFLFVVVSDSVELIESRPQSLTDLVSSAVRPASADVRFRACSALSTKGI